MKCQKCNKPAVFHITENTDEVPVELHFCAQHAKEYLYKTTPEVEVVAEDATGKSSTKKKKSASVQKTTEELMEIDFQSCPYCGLGFQDFRKDGLLGCANDYSCFEELLDPLLMSIHGGTEHVGKRPARFGGTEQGTILVRLRRELQDAISIEDYEKASQLRDYIREIELKMVH
ncbi:MAG: UvrB/UvrC motif-containing protein [Planctomycetia bacterium]|nr:UvrB/UvrC motif-containing protein [Planctomycetia bacterium]